MNVNELGTTADFLADNNMMPPLIVVGIINTDRARDLTPYNAGIKHTDGSVEEYPTSGGILGVLSKPMNGSRADGSGTSSGPRNTRSCCERYRESV